MNYTMLIQHTTSKNVYLYNLENSNYAQNIYFKFDINVGDVEEGEYQYIIFENPHKYDVFIDYNNARRSELNGNPVILVTFENTLTNGTEILVAGKRIKCQASGLMRIGDYENDKYQYDKQTKYQVYERK